jgi:hypothetical protein
MARRPKRERFAPTYALLAIFVLAYVLAWFLFNVTFMPPYIPGSTMDPLYAPPKAVAGLAIFTAALILPGSALACALAFRRRARLQRRTAAMS